MKTDANKPFASDAEFLDAAFDLLTVRVQRLSAERELHEAATRMRGDPNTVGRPRRVTEDDATRCIATLKELEEDVQRSLDARRAANRADPDAPTLGIDRLAEKHGLSDDERMVLLSASSFAISERMAEDIHEDLAVGMYGSQSVEGLMRLLGAQTVADRLRARRIFAPTAPLVRRGLIILDYHGREAQPEDLIGARVQITRGAFDILVGNGPALSVLP